MFNLDWKLQLTQIILQKYNICKRADPKNNLKLVKLSFYKLNVF